MKASSQHFQHKFDREKLSQASPETWKQFFKCWPEVQWEVGPIHPRYGDRTGIATEASSILSFHGTEEEEHSAIFKRTMEDFR